MPVTSSALVKTPLILIFIIVLERESGNAANVAESDNDMTEWVVL